MAAAQEESKTGHLEALLLKGIHGAARDVCKPSGHLAHNTASKIVHVACPARNRRGWNRFIEISADRADAASLQALAVSY